MNTTTMTRDEFARLLSERTGAFAVGLKTRTEPRVRKTNNPNPTVVRVTRRNGFLGGDFESCTNNLRERQGGERDFTAQPLPWGEHLNRYLIGHKGALYLKVFPVATGCKGEDRWETPEGKALDFDAEVKPFLPETKQDENKAAWRTIALKSIEEVTMDGAVITLTA